MSTQTQSADTTEVLALETAADTFTANKGRGTTDRTYNNGVQHFTEWAATKGIADTSDVGAFILEGFNDWVTAKVESEEWAPRTARTYSGAAREFVHYLEKLGVGVPRMAHEHIERYELDPQEQKTELFVSPERAKAIVRWLRLNRPHSRDAVIFWILAETGMRMGCGLRGIDVNDIGIDDDGDAYIYLVDRPKDKRGSNMDDGMKAAKHQRKVPISDDLHTEIRRYIRVNRIEASEPESHYGTRRPLLTTQYHGEGRRASDKTIRGTVHRLTCPKTTGITIDGDCSCDVAPTTKDAGDCELSDSPHGLRGTVVTRLKDEGFEYEEMEDYLGATAEVLRTTYDRADEDRRKDRVKGLGLVPG